MNKYTLSNDQLSFITNNFFQWSFDKPEGYVPDKNLFLQLSHPAELHYIAWIYNWDDGPIVSEWILESPLCSRATANLIFWRSLPSEYEDTDFSDPATCPEYGEDGFSLIPRILDRYKKNDFASIDIAFDPSEEIEPVTIKNGKWGIPDGVYDVIEGLNLYQES